MNCTCIKDLESKVRDHVATSIKGEITSVECGNTAFVLGESSMRLSLFVPFNIKADAPGYRSKQGKMLPVHISFCPFCGQSAKRQVQHDADKVDIHAALAAAQANVTHLSLLADRWLAVRDVPDNLVGEAGIPCVAVPEGPKRGYYVSGEHADQAVDKIIAARAQQGGQP